jgi:transcriptional regulator with XRE-family HTH domain
MKLSTWMDREDLSDEKFAQRLSDIRPVDRSTIWRIRNGSHKPSPELMEAIAKATGGEVLPNDYFDDLPVAA